MKNTIKNYIKIMGLAAVPFGTAQADNYEIRVTQDHKPDAEHFRISVISVNANSLKKNMIEIVWPHDKRYPNPIFEPNGCLRVYGNELRKGMEMVPNICFWGQDMENLLEWAYFYKDAFGKMSFEEVCSMFRWIHPDKIEELESLVKQCKRGLEFEKEKAQKYFDEYKKTHNSREFEGMIGLFSYPRLVFLKGCTCVMYDFDRISGCWLMRDFHHLTGDHVYTFGISFNGLGCVDIDSDIPTVCSVEAHYGLCVHIVKF